MFAIRRKSSDDFDAVIDRLDSAGGSASWAGMNVTSKTAMQQATVYACVRILAETIAALPIKVQTQQSENGARYWVDSDHDALGVLMKPNDWQTQHDLLSMWVSWAELRGNAYSLKLKSTRGRVRHLYPLQSTSVTVDQRQDWSLRYTVGEENGVSGDYGPEQILHIRNFGSNGYEGLSTIAKLRHDIGLSQRAKEHGSRVLESGGTMNMWVKADSVKNREQAKEYQEQFRDQYGGAHNRNKVPVLFGGASLEEIGVSAEDAQLLETLRFQKQELAAAFGVPLFLLNDTEKSTTWGTGLEQITKSFMRFSLRPRLNRITSTLARELLSRPELTTTRFVFDTDAFTMGSFKEVMEASEKAIMHGILNPNEARDLINRNPRDGGDEYRESPNSLPEGSQGEDNGNETTDAPA